MPDAENADFGTEAYQVGVNETDDGEVLIVSATQKQEYRGLDGEPTVADVPVMDFVVRADEDLVEKLGHALLTWHAEQGSSGPPGQRPIHDQYAAMEPDR